jgi:predicted nucleotide-binding protein
MTEQERQPIDPAWLKSLLTSLDEQDSIVIEVSRSKDFAFITPTQNNAIQRIFADIETSVPGLAGPYEPTDDCTAVHSQLRVARNAVQGTIDQLTQREKLLSSTLLPETPNKRRVFVIHGRNMQARDAMFTFLRSIDLDPIEWEEAIQMTAEASPYLGNVLDMAFANAQAAVVMITGDDIACLGEQFVQTHDSDFEKLLSPQARPNVLFEMGMAFGKFPHRTLIVEFCHTRPFSDVTGRNTVHFSDNATNRKKIADRLKNAGCAVRTDNKTDWLKEGDFSSAQQMPQHTTSDLVSAQASISILQTEIQKRNEEIATLTRDREKLFGDTLSLNKRAGDLENERQQLVQQIEDGRRNFEKAEEERTKLQEKTYPASSSANSSTASSPADNLPLLLVSPDFYSIELDRRTDSDSHGLFLTVTNDRLGMIRQYKIVGRSARSFDTRHQAFRDPFEFSTFVIDRANIIGPSDTAVGGWIIRKASQSDHLLAGDNPTSPMRWPPNDKSPIQKWSLSLRIDAFIPGKAGAPNNLQALSPIEAELIVTWNPSNDEFILLQPLSTQASA